MPTKSRKKNPVLEGGAVPFPHIAADYPFKPWIDRETGETFSTVTVQQDDGTFVCLVADQPEIRFTAKDRTKAEQGLLKLFRERRRNPEDAEEAEIRKLVADRRGGPSMPWREWMKKYAR